MKNRFIRTFQWLALLSTAFLLSGCGYNDIQSSDEAVSAQWAEVLNQYQRRADLIPALVATAKGYASHEQAVFAQIAEARAKIGGISQNQNAPNDAPGMAAYRHAQQELGSALSRLLVIREQYPELKADMMFSNLMVQLEGTENRIAVARHRYVKAVQSYNLQIRQFPGVIIARVMGYERKQNFQPDDVGKVSTAPVVDFSASPQGH
jgi:Uncharacterized conserved protein